MKNHDFSQMNWKTIEKEMANILGPEFWEDLTEFLPKQGPRVDIYETDYHVMVIMELPGLQTTEGIRISLKNSVLSIQGEIKTQYPVPSEKLLKSERFFGEFRREIQIPRFVASTPIKARYTNGLLVIQMLKMEEEEKNIPIEYEGDNPVLY